MKELVRAKADVLSGEPSQFKAKNDNDHEKISISETIVIDDETYDIIHKDDEFSQEFINKMKRMEKEEFIDVDDLDSLFE